jgi:DNA-3-methyladenine glycosylase
LKPLPHAFYDRPTEAVAQELIGRTLVHVTDEGPVGGVIAETEAYGPDDPANHAFRGQTARNAPMFGPPGYAYVYRIYGVHWCLNAVTGGQGIGEAVLIRALQPVVGTEFMRANRSMDDETRLCRGPGALCAALRIAGERNGEDLMGPRLVISEERVEGLDIRATTRIGLTKAADSPFVSGPRRLVFQGGR